MIEKMYGAEIFYDDVAKRTHSEKHIPMLMMKVIRDCFSAKSRSSSVRKGKPFIFSRSCAVKPK